MEKKEKKNKTKHWSILFLKGNYWTAGLLPPWGSIIMTTVQKLAELTEKSRVHVNADSESESLIPKVHHRRGTLTTLRGWLLGAWEAWEHFHRHPWNFLNLLFKKILFYTGVEMIYNAVLVSGVRQSDSVTHISILFQILFPFRLL